MSHPLPSTTSPLSLFHGPILRRAALDSFRKLTLCISSGTP